MKPQTNVKRFADEQPPVPPSAPAAPGPPNPFQLNQCPDCGYALTGLPERGQCPECGFEYGPEQVVLYGWARGNHANAANSRRGTMILALLAPAWLLIQVAHNFAVGRGWRALGFLAAWVLIFCFLLHRRRRLAREAPAPAQVRLFPAGLAQRDGIGKVTLRPWRVGLVIEIRPLTLSSDPDGRYHLRARNRLRWTGLVLSEPVDLEFDCDAATADRLREHIDSCRRRAFTGGAAPNRNG